MIPVFPVLYHQARIKREQMTTRITDEDVLDTDNVVVALYEKTSGIAFGPTFDTSDAANSFLDWLQETDGRDAATIPSNDLVALYNTWYDITEGGTVKAPISSSSNDDTTTTTDDTDAAGVASETGSDGEATAGQSSETATDTEVEEPASSI